MTINCISVDDEPLALKKIKTFIDKISYLNLLATFDNAIDAMHFLKNNEVDLMFLDIQMDNLTGIQLLEALHKKPHVVLITAYDHFALQGYELNVTDYLLKPVAFNRFVKSAEKVHSQMLNHIESSQNSNVDNIVFLKSGNKIEKVNLDEVLYIEGMKDYLRIHLQSKRIMILQTFKRIQSYLDSNKFKRVHKSYIVSIDKIATIESGKIEIAGEQIPIGDSYRKEFYKFIKENQNI